MLTGPETSEANDLTIDGFLDGRLQLKQPRTGFRAGVDSVFLAASVNANPGQNVLEMGCGPGVALCCLGQRCPDISLFGVEIQSHWVQLARENTSENDLDADIFEGDVRALPPQLKARQFDHVMFNPPFFRSVSVSTPSDPAKVRAHCEIEAAISDWISAGAARLRPGGTLSIIHRAEALSDILVGLSAVSMGRVRILPMLSRVGRPAKRVIVLAQKGSRAELRLLAPFVLHEVSATLSTVVDLPRSHWTFLRMARGSLISREIPC